MDQSVMASMNGMDMGTATTTSAAAATSSGMDMAGMDMGMGGGSCKISMLWNWHTIDACFLTKSWHITSHGMFAGSCIGVILLVMVLEALRRAAKEYELFLIRKRTKALPSQTVPASGSDPNRKDNVAQTATPLPARKTSFRPTLVEQTIRALLHMLQFAVAYFVMLLAMYFNGYIIICIFIGAFLGAFAFNWTSIGSGDEEQEVTFCCG